MKIELLVVGKTTQTFVRDGLDEFTQRIKRYIPFNIVVIPELKNTKSLSVSEQKQKEGELIVKSLRADDYVTLLDEKGKDFTSQGFAKYIEGKMNTLPGRLVFIIGGPYGFSEEVYARAKETITLSKMTFSHQLIRLIFAEQLYRAFTILRNEPYHHE